MTYTAICPQCHEENPGHQLHCIKCGTSLMGIPRQAQPSSPAEQSATEAMSARRQVALIEQKIKVENLFKGSANNFFWIAGLSLVNSIVPLVGGHWSFFIGLGITQFIDGVSIAIAQDLEGNGATIVRAIAFVIDLGIAGIFALFGLFARKRYKWAFVIGMVLYALDGLIFLMVPDLLSIGFHLFILYGLYLGLKSVTKLHGIEQTIAA
jgi:hypothetical protein